MSPKPNNSDKQELSPRVACGLILLCITSSGLAVFNGLRFQKVSIHVLSWGLFGAVYLALVALKLCLPPSKLLNVTSGFLVLLNVLAVFPYPLPLELKSPISFAENSAEIGWLLFVFSLFFPIHAGVQFACGFFLIAANVLLHVFFVGNVVLLEIIVTGCYQLALLSVGAASSWFTQKMHTLTRSNLQTFVETETKGLEISQVLDDLIQGQVSEPQGCLALLEEATTDEVEWPSNQLLQKHSTHFSKVTLLLLDINGLNDLLSASSLTDQSGLLDRLFYCLRQLGTDHGAITTSGGLDHSILFVLGLHGQPDHPMAGLGLALAIDNWLKTLSEVSSANLQARCKLHAGQVDGGFLGQRPFGHALFGPALVDLQQPIPRDMAGVCASGLFLEMLENKVAFAPLQGTSWFVLSARARYNVVVDAQTAGRVLMSLPPCGMALDVTRPMLSSVPTISIPKWPSSYPHVRLPSQRSSLMIALTGFALVVVGQALLFRQATPLAALLCGVVSSCLLICVAIGDLALRINGHQASDFVMCATISTSCFLSCGGILLTGLTATHPVLTLPRMACLALLVSHRRSPFYIKIVLALLFGAGMCSIAFTTTDILWISLIALTISLDAVVCTREHRMACFFIDKVQQSAASQDRYIDRVLALVANFAPESTVSWVHRRLLGHEDYAPDLAPRCTPDVVCAVLRFSDVDTLGALRDAYSRLDALLQDSRFRGVKRARAVRTDVLLLADATCGPSLVLDALLCLLSEVDLRCGVALGPVTSAVVGPGQPALRLWGQTLDVATLMAVTATVDRIQVSESVYERARTTHRFLSRKRLCLEVPGRADFYAYRLGGPKRGGSELSLGSFPGSRPPSVYSQRPGSNFGLRVQPSSHLTAVPETYTLEKGSSLHQTTTIE